jgi:hypothetical protein
MPVAGRGDVIAGERDIGDPGTVAFNEFFGRRPVGDDQPYVTLPDQHGILPVVVRSRHLGKPACLRKVIDSRLLIICIQVDVLNVLGGHERPSLRVTRCLRSRARNTVIRPLRSPAPRHGGQLAI